MEENKFYDLYGYHLNPLEMNNWMLCQQPYFNYPLDAFPNNIGISYGGLPLQNEYEQLFIQGNYPNISKSNFFPPKPADNYKSNWQNNKNEYHKKNKNSRLNHSPQNNNQNKMQKSENNLTDTCNNKGTYEILNRNKKGDDEKFRKAFSSTVKIDLDKDFPPISDSVVNEPIIVYDKTLDYRLALQKPKPVVLLSDNNKVNKENIKDENQEKVKKKRKRNRKKKIVEKPVEPFAFVDEEFPTLEIVKIEENSPVGKDEPKTMQDTVKVNKIVSYDERKKSKKRQLLFILPGDMEGQVRVIQAPTVQKNKTKRKVNQDRMKKPIGVLNPLDLSAPLVKRGKERLKPKPKKPSKLKKAILHYRNLKKELREKANCVLPTNEDTTAIPTIISEPELVIPEKKSDNLTSRMHSKNFREYCNHMIDNKINSIISQLLKTLIGFQDKLYNRDPLKAKLKRRLCFGLREVTKFANMKKLRLIIIAPDLEKIEIEGGLDDIVSLIIKSARESGIPYVFGLSRSSLAYLCYKKYRVGAIGVFNYDGAEMHVKELLVCVDKAREQYNQIKQIMESINQDVSTFSPALSVNCTHSSDDKCNPIRSNDTIPYHAGHSRTPSNALSEPISDIGEMNKLLFNSIMEDQFNSANSDKEDKNQNSDNDVNEEKDENKLIDDYVENILNSVAKLNIASEHV